MTSPARWWSGNAELRRLSDLCAALKMIADIAEGSGTPNSLPHIAKIARDAVAKAEGRT
jgi:hypothetical protein